MEPWTSLLYQTLQLLYEVTKYWVNFKIINQFLYNDVQVFPRNNRPKCKVITRQKLFLTTTTGNDARLLIKLYSSHLGLCTSKQSVEDLCFSHQYYSVILPKLTNHQLLKYRYFCCILVDNIPFYLNDSKTT